MTAPIIEAQLVETAILNFCHFQTVLASKAVRSVLAARGRPVVEFGLRRTPGIDAGMKAARSAFLAGAGMSSNVLAGLAYGIPPMGTMAHSYVIAFPEELDAFRAFVRGVPGPHHAAHRHLRRRGRGPQGRHGRPRDGRPRSPAGRACGSTAATWSR